jgi:hypothetical protein
MGLSAVNTLIGFAKWTDVFFYVLDYSKGQSLLTLPGVATNRAQFANPGQ